MNSITRQIDKTNAIEIENDTHIVLVSYATPVAFLFKGTDSLKPFANITEAKFSATTTRHINAALARWINVPVAVVPQHKIERLAANL